MKTSKYLLAIVFFCNLAISCQKPFGPEPSLVSSGTLSKDNSGNCLPVSLNGIYKAGTALNTTHYMDVSVNVTAAGNYQIITDTLNGIHFGDTAQFSATGLQVVRLKAYGTPVSAGTFSFTVNYGNSSSCAVAVTVTTTNSPLASFTLTGAPGACTTPIILGTYMVGTMLNTSNTLSVSATVTSPGDYTLSTLVINGISFSAAGTFTTTGNKTIILSGSGRPLTATTNQMVVSGTATSCSFSLTVTAVPPVDPVAAIFLSTREYDPVNSTSYISLTCYNPDKTVRWKRTQLGNSATYNNNFTFFNRTPSIEYANGVAYFSSDSVFSTSPYFRYHFFYAIDVNTGNDIWKIRSTTDNMENEIVRNGIVYCNSQNSAGVNHIAAYDAANGNFLWKTPIAEFYGADYLQLEGNTLYYISNMANRTALVNAFDVVTKTVLWQKNIGANLGATYSKMVNAAGLIVIKNGTGNLLALNKTDGSTVWSKAGFDVPILANNMIYALGNNHVFYAFAPGDGAIRYQWPAALNIGSSPYVLDDNFYFTGTDPVPYIPFVASYNALSATTQLNWSKPTGAPQSESPVVADNTVYAIKRGPIVGVSTTYTIMMFDRGTGNARDSIITSGTLVGAIGILKSSGSYVEPNF